jgi:enoyl-CoA hydratase
MGITYEARDGVGTITLDDGKVNAMAEPVFAELNAALDRAETDRPLAVVIAGRQGYFSAGLNLKVLPTLAPADFERTMVAFGETMLRVFAFPIPTVAAITGHAIAGGAFLAYACDERYFAYGPYKIHVNEVAIALPLPTWAVAIAQTAIPQRCHVEAILHARAFNPEEAVARNLVHAVVPPTDSVVTEARKAAERLAGLDLPAYAVAKTKMRERDVAWARKNLAAEAKGDRTRAPL